MEMAKLDDVLPKTLEPQKSELEGGSLTASVIGSIVRAGLNSAPFTGGIASLWSDWDTSRRFARVEAAIRQLMTILDGLQDRLAQATVGEPEMQLLEDAINRIAREHREHKRMQFVNVIASNLIYTSRSFDERSLFIRALDRLDELHFRILKLLRQRHNDGLEPIHANELYREIFGDRPDEESKYGLFVPAMVTLAMEFGFVRRRSASEGKLMTSVNPDGLQLTTVCSIFPIGVRFLDSIELRLPTE
jgi:hypothetical protein